MAAGGTSRYADTEVTKKEIVILFLQNPHNFRFDKKLCDKQATEMVKTSLGIIFNEKEDSEVQKIISTLRFDFEKRYVKFRGQKERFFESPENSKWLQSYFRLPANYVLSSLKAKKVKVMTPVPTVSRQTKPFTELAASSKRRKLALLSKTMNGHSTKEIVLTASKSVKTMKENELSKLLKTVSSPEKAAKVIAKLKQPDLTAYSPAEALNFFLEKCLTWNNYNSIRLESKVRGADIYPSYKKIKTERKCIRPRAETIHVSDFTAFVETQSLLNNTAQRLIKLQNEVITTIVTSKKCKELNITLFCSWGCDGSSSQSIYNQKASTQERQDFDESHLFATTVTPLRMIAFLGESTIETVVWNNVRPQSYRSCRPLKLIYKKETKELTLAEIKRVQDDISLLSPYEESWEDGLKIIVSFSMYLSVIDGKVLAAITGVPCINCPLCESKPTDFNVKENIGTIRFQANPQSLSHGASPLHARIRFMEFLFNVGIRMDVKVWRICDDADKVKVSERRKFVQDEFQRILNLRIDFPNPGGSGNSNTGNTARMFFENYKVSSKILGIDEDLVFRFRNILISLNCKLPLKAAEFGQYCLDTNSIFLDLYSWYKIPSSVHKILIHSKEIILSSILPIGMLAEEGAESRNKYYRSDKIHHARQNSRENGLQDIFNRALETSDPLIASFSTCAQKTSRNAKPLPSEVICFLQEPSFTPLFTPNASQSSTSSTQSNDFDENSSVCIENEDLDAMMNRKEDMLMLIAEDLDDLC